MDLTATAAPFRSYVSVMPRTGRPIDLDVTLLREAGMTTRGLGTGPIVYVFLDLEDRFDAMEAVSALIGSTGSVVDHGTAAAGATRVAIDPRLIAA